MKFYKLGKDDKYKYLDYSYEETDWHSIKCPVYDGHQRAGNRTALMELEIADKKPRDFYWTFLSELAVTDKVAELFEYNNITGYWLNPTTLVKNKVGINALWEFIVTGNGGLSDNYRLYNECEFCGHKRYRDKDQTEEGYIPLKKVIVNESQWDGSDIFTVEGLDRYVLITEKVKDLIIKSNLKGSIICRAEDLDEQIYP